MVIQIPIVCYLDLRGKSKRGKSDSENVKAFKPEDAVREREGLQGGTFFTTMLIGGIINMLFKLFLTFISLSIFMGFSLLAIWLAYDNFAAWLFCIGSLVVMVLFALLYADYRAGFNRGAPSLISNLITDALYIILLSFPIIHVLHGRGLISEDLFEFAESHYLYGVIIISLGMISTLIGVVRRKYSKQKAI